MYTFVAKHFKFKMRKMLLHIKNWKVFTKYLVLCLDTGSGYLLSICITVLKYFYRLFLISATKSGMKEEECKLGLIYDGGVLKVDSFSWMGRGAGLPQPPGPHCVSAAVWGRPRGRSDSPPAWLCVPRTARSPARQKARLRHTYTRTRGRACMQMSASVCERHRERSGVWSAALR